MQEYLQRRKQEVAKLEAELEEARAALDSHDQAVRARASDLETLASQMESAESELHSEREEARKEELAIKAQLAEMEESRRVASQVRTSTQVNRFIGLDIAWGIV